MMATPDVLRTGAKPQGHADQLDEAETIHELRAMFANADACHLSAYEVRAAATLLGSASRLGRDMFLALAVAVAPTSPARSGDCLLDDVLDKTSLDCEFCAYSEYLDVADTAESADLAYLYASRYGSPDYYERLKTLLAATTTGVDNSVCQNAFYGLVHASLCGNIPLVQHICRSEFKMVTSVDVDADVVSAAALSAAALCVSGKPGCLQAATELCDKFGLATDDMRAAHALDTVCGHADAAALEWLLARFPEHGAYDVIDRHYTPMRLALLHAKKNQKQVLALLKRLAGLLWPGDVLHDDDRPYAPPHDGVVGFVLDTGDSELVRWLLYEQFPTARVDAAAFAKLASSGDDALFLELFIRELEASETYRDPCALFADAAVLGDPKRQHVGEIMALVERIVRLAAPHILANLHLNIGVHCFMIDGFARAAELGRVWAMTALTILLRDTGLLTRDNEKEFCGQLCYTTRDAAVVGGHAAPFIWIVQLCTVLTGKSVDMLHSSRGSALLAAAYADQPSLFNWFNERFDSLGEPQYDDYMRLLENAICNDGVGAFETIVAVYGVDIAGNAAKLVIQCCKNNAERILTLLIEKYGVTRDLVLAQNPDILEILVSTLHIMMQVGPGTRNDERRSIAILWRIADAFRMTPLDFSNAIKHACLRRVILANKFRIFRTYMRLLYGPGSDLLTVYGLPPMDTEPRGEVSHRLQEYAAWSCVHGRILLLKETFKRIGTVSRVPYFDRIYRVLLAMFRSDVDLATLRWLWQTFSIDFAQSPSIIPGRFNMVITDWVCRVSGASFSVTLTDRSGRDYTFPPSPLPRTCSRTSGSGCLSHATTPLVSPFQTDMSDQ